MNQLELIHDIADALVALDNSGTPFKQFRPGVGPYGEPQLVRYVAQYLNCSDKYKGVAKSKRTPDLLITGRWALEFKITRPFGDNGKEAENWSVNLLHPYPGNVSAIGDCLKLLKLEGVERKAVVVIGYEHNPPEIPLAPLLSSFEILASKVCGIHLGRNVMAKRDKLIHPIHQQLLVSSWEVLGRI